MFDLLDYKEIVNRWIHNQPKKGHGQLRKIANELKVNSVVTSQVFRGERHLTLDQGLIVSRYLGHSPLERDYFLILIQRERAGTYALKKVLDSQLEALRKSKKQLKKNLEYTELTNEDHGLFYSHWCYSAIRLISDIPNINSTQIISRHLDIDLNTTSRILNFLIHKGLVIKSNDHKLSLGPQVTHLGHDSPFVKNHHANWRVKALETQSQTHLSDDCLFYSGPMVVSKSTALEIRELLLKTITKSTSLAKNSLSETVRCLNIDWFRLSKDIEDYS